MAPASATAEALAPESELSRRELNRVRSRYLELRDQRLQRIKDSLQREQRQFLELLPLLFHVNHPLLPGFIDTRTPAGVADYAASRQELLLARRHARSLAARRGRAAGRVIRGIYLMGSLGSLGQDRGSDLDIWLCHASGLTTAARAALHEKIAGIEAWGRNYGLQVHIFAVQAEAFREGLTLPLSDESSGRLGRHLLLEEFYRTGVLLAGLVPAWWLVPAEYEAEYASRAERLRLRRLVPRKRWLDFGGLDAVPPQEFYSAAQWQLHKSIAAPYKALLKLMLAEAYVADYPEVDWAALQIKRALFGHAPVDADRLDPYRLILDRITTHLRRRGESDRLELARRAFYVKADQPLAQRRDALDWRRRGLEALLREWRWSAATRERMDGRHDWKLDAVMQERNALVAELAHGLRLLGEFARTHSPDAGPDARELGVLGRKLNASLERRPGKIERVNPGISRDLSEPALWLVRDDAGRWRLYRAPPAPGRPATREAGSLVELLVWVQVNGLADATTRLHLDPAPPPARRPEHERLLRALQRHLAGSDADPGGMAAFNTPAHPAATLLFLDVGRDPQDPDPSPVLHLDRVVLSSWGEILVDRQDGGLAGLVSALCHYLESRLPGQPAALHAYSFAAARAGQLASQLTRLAQAAADWFDRHGAEARYALRLERELYLLDWRDGHCRSVAIGERAGLHELLAEPVGGFRPTRIDPATLPQSPLPLLFEAQGRGVIDVFYRVHTTGIDMWVLDDLGTLFAQQLPETDEGHFLAHQHRFFDSVLVRRLLHGTVGAADYGQALRYHRLSRNERGWRLRQVEPPPSRSHLELLLLPGPGGADYRVICGEQEFDAGRLGGRFYGEVAAAVLQRRRSAARYPIYITGVQPVDGAVPWSVARLLELKRRLERRLNAAAGLHGPDLPDL